MYKFLHKILAFVLVGSILLNSTVVNADTIVPGGYVVRPLVAPATSFGGLQTDHSVTTDFVDQFTGTLEYSYPLELPSGRGAAQPIVSLVYRHTAKDIYSNVGLGWDLSIPRIYRYSKHGVDGLYTDRHFISTLPVASGEYTADSVDTSGYGSYVQLVRTSANRIIFDDDNTWEITDSHGTIYRFGEAANALEASEDSTKTFAWYLTSITDTNGNTVSYSYTKSQGGVYPTKISYGSATQPIEIRFEPYLNGSISQFDVTPSYSRLFPVVEKKEPLTQIEIADPVSDRKLRYSFTYTDEGTYRLLASIIKSGVAADESTTTLPATQFTYAAYQGENSSQLQLPEGVSMDTNINGYYVPYWLYTDYDDDGWEDLAISTLTIGTQSDVYRREVRLRSGLTWGSTQTVTNLPTWFIDRYGVKESHVPFSVDLNGDFHSVFCLDGQDTTSCSDSGPQLSYGWSGNHNDKSLMLDLNGDQLLDALQISDSNISGADLFIKTNNGSLLSGPGYNYLEDPNTTPWYLTNWQKVVGSQTVSSNLYEGTSLIDLNNDGLADVIHYRFEALSEHGTVIPNSEVITKKVLINKGDGTWDDLTDIINIPRFFYRHYADRYDTTTPELEGYLLDINSDGLPDFVNSVSTVNYQQVNHVKLNTGKGWETESSMDSPILWLGQNENTTRNDPRYLDLNKDGVLGNDFASNGATIVGLPILTNIQMPIGGSIAVEYTPASSYLNPDGSLANHDLPIPYLTVSEVTTNPGSYGVSGSTSYSYANGKLYRPDEAGGIQKQEFQGFGSAKKTLPDGTEIVSTFTQGTPETNFASKGFLLKETTNSASETLLQETKNKITTTTIITGKSFETKTDSTVTSIFNAASASKAKASGFTYDTYGNVTTETNYGEVNSVDTDGNFTDIGTDKVVTTRIFALNTDANINSLPSSEELTDQNNQLIGKTEWLYDSLSLGQVVKGNQTSEKRWIDATNTSETLVAYDTDGLPNTVTDPLNHSTTYTYNALRLHPATVTNAKNQTTDFVYDTLTGTALETTDPNNSVTQTKLDGVGRPIEVWISDPASPANLVKQQSITYEINTTSGYQKITRNNYPASGATPVATYQFLDGFQREFETGTQTATNKFSLSVQGYNARGFITKKSLPFEVSAVSPQQISSVATNLVITLAYDGLGRVISEQNAVGTTNTAYNLWETTITNANNHQKDLVNDAFGRLIAVHEHLGAQAYETDYTYSPAGNLIQITDSQDNEKEFTYDLLGRKLSETLFHTSTDSTPGISSYVYDANGNLTSLTNPRNQTTSFTHDELNRLSTETYNSVTQASYTYDSGNYSGGRLSAVVTPNLTKAFTYDILGRMLSETKTIDSTGYTTGFTYDLLGKVQSITYPGGVVISNTYNAADLLESVSQNSNTVVSNITYAPTGAVTQMDYANGVTTTNTYNANQLYRLTNKLTTKDSKNLQNIAYGFDAVGNITSITDTSNADTAKTAAYVYDDLDRLTSATVTNTANNQNYTQTYTYDAIGNITSRSDVGSYTYAGDHPHAVTTAGSKTYTYDADGNLTSDGVWTHSYDYKDRLVASTNGVATLTYVYDEGNTRIKKITPNETTIYVNQYYEIRNGEAKQFIYAGEEKVATLLSEALSYPQGELPASGEWIPTQSSLLSGNHLGKENVKIHLTPETRLTKSGDNLLLLLNHTQPVSGSIIYNHTDHLSGSNIETDENGYVVEELDYYPYGDIRIDKQNTTYSDDYKYTGKELDTETHLYYYGARYYDASIGRFTAIDPWSGDISDPQSFNKYSYVRNNPLKYVDPSGKNPLLAVMAIGALALTIHTWYTQGPTAALEVAPYSGDLNDIYAGMTGRSLFDGRVLTEDERSMMVFAATVPMFTGGEMREGKKIMNKADEVIEETISATKKNFTSNHILSETEALEAGEKFVGKDYKELDSGVFRSKDDTKQFRIDDASLGGKHKPNVPHAHLEIFENGKTQPIVNNHIPLKK